MPSLKKEWILTREAFERLLARLDPDREQAAEKYEDLRQALITYFEFRGFSDPAVQADETINRVARRIFEGVEISTRNPANYFYAVARNVWRERLAQPEIIVSSLNDPLSPQSRPEDPEEARARQADREDEERRLECLERCLSALPPESRELITRYYQYDKGAKIRNRRELAQALQIPLNALRIRACRIRDKLEDCMRNCLRDLSGA